MKSIYDQAVAAKLEMDHHESDLYLKDTRKAWEIIRAWEKDKGYSCGATRFQSDGPWIDVPFMYEPFWKSKEHTGGRAV